MNYRATRIRRREERDKRKREMKNGGWGASLRLSCLETLSGWVGGVNDHMTTSSWRHSLLQVNSDVPTCTDQSVGGVPGGEDVVGP